MQTELTADLIKKIRDVEAKEFQDTILEAVNHHIGPYPVKILGLEYWMFPGCFDPGYAKASRLLIENMGVVKGDDVLIQFSGPGFDAHYTYQQGAKKVVSVEKETLPFLCAKYNTSINGLEEFIDNRQGDLFEPIKTNEKFDLIVANPPFKNMNPKSIVEGSIRDKNYSTLIRFWNEASDFLKEKGRMRVVFSDVGDMDFFHSLAKKNNFVCETVAREKYASKVRIEVYEFRKSSY